MGLVAQVKQLCAYVHEASGDERAYAICVLEEWLEQWHEQHPSRERDLAPQLAELKAEAELRVLVERNENVRKSVSDLLSALERRGGRMALVLC